jgi:hypothetical protein
LIPKGFFNLALGFKTLKSNGKVMFGVYPVSTFTELATLSTFTYTPKCLTSYIAIGFFDLFFPIPQCFVSRCLVASPRNDERIFV